MEGRFIVEKWPKIYCSVLSRPELRLNCLMAHGFIISVALMSLALWSGWCTECVPLPDKLSAEDRSLISSSPGTSI